VSWKSVTRGRGRGRGKNRVRGRVTIEMSWKSVTQVHGKLSKFQCSVLTW